MTSKKRLFEHLEGIPDELSPILKKEGKDHGPLSSSSSSSSRYLGVHWDGVYWRASIRSKGELHDLGHFKDEAAAGRAFARAYAWREKQNEPEVYGGLDLSQVSKDIPPLIANKGDSKYKGVTKNGNRWQAKIYIQGKCTALGTFETPEQAGNVYARAAYFLKHRQQSQQSSRSTEQEDDSVYAGLDLRRVPKILPLIHAASGSKYRYEGVAPYQGKWRARIRIASQMKRLGLFETEKQAALAYARVTYYLKQKMKSSREVSDVYGGLDLTNVPRDLPLRLAPSGNFMGVKRNGKHWQAYITLPGSRFVALGTFKTIQQAALVHTRAAYYLEHQFHKNQTNKKSLPPTEPDNMDVVEMNHDSDNHKDADKSREESDCEDATRCLPCTKSHGRSGTVVQTNEARGAVADNRNTSDALLASSDLQSGSDDGYCSDVFEV